MLSHTHTVTQHHRPLCAAHRDRPLVGEEAAQDHHLADADQQYDDRLTDGPVVDPPVEVLGEDSALRLTQTVVGLVVEDYLELVVDELRRRLHLQRDESWRGIALNNRLIQKCCKTRQPLHKNMCFLCKLFHVDVCDVAPIKTVARLPRATWNFVLIAYSTLNTTVN